jgi:spoIIIJ-associated protein
VQARNEERRSVVASGKTVEDAIAEGLTLLGVQRGDVDVEILSEGSRGVLGFGAEDARARLLLKPQPAPEPVAPAPDEVMAREQGPEPAVVTPVTSTAASGTMHPAEEPDQELGSPTPEQVGREILTDLLNHMGIGATVESRLGDELAEEGEPPPAVLNILGDDLGILIGRRGETLRALQYLVRLMVSHRLKHWTNLVVDVEHYRVRRRRTLDTLAKRVADDVVRSGRSQALEPMPAYERRLVHISLRNHPQVATQSVGEGEKRKVTIFLKA